MSEVTADSAGLYYCVVSYEEEGADAATPFSSSQVNLYVRTWVTELTTPQYIKTGEAVSLVCELTVAASSELDETDGIKWYIDGVSQDSGITTDDYNDSDNTYKSTFEIASDSVDKDTGGTYKCEYNFVTGDPITSETALSAHLLTALDASYINPSSLECVFEGTNAPTFTWYAGGSEILDDNTDDAYSVNDGSWTDNAQTSTLTITDLATGETAISCAISFATDGVDDTLSTTTTVIVKEISDFSATTYTTGDAVTLSCVADFGTTGTGPTSAAWTGLDALTSDDYEIDAGSNGDDGLRTTTLTFATPDALKYAATYTCAFVFADDDNDYSEEIELIVRCKLLI